MLALMVARNSFGRDRIRLALICPSPRSGFSPAVEESVLEHNYRLTVIRPQSLAKLPTSRLLDSQDERPNPDPNA